MLGALLQMHLAGELDSLQQLSLHSFLESAALLLPISRYFLMLEQLCVNVNSAILRSSNIEFRWLELSVAVHLFVTLLSTLRK